MEGVSVGSSKSRFARGHTQFMRLAHVLMGRCNPDSANGVDKTVYYLSRAQARLGHTIAVFSLTGKEPLPIEGVEVRAYPPVVRSGGRALTSVANLLNRSITPPAMRRDLVKWRPDWIHFHSVHIPTHIALARCFSKDGVPYCVTPHGGLAEGARRRRWWLKHAIGLLAERRYLQKARFVHTVSPADEEGLQGYGVRTRTVRAPNCIDLASVPDLKRSDVLRRQFRWLYDRRIFLFLGRLDPDTKGLDLLLQAFAQSQRRDAALVLVGPDWHGGRARLETTSRRLGIEDAVLLPGPAYGQAKWEALASADVFVHTSRWEGVPFSVLEAMAVGLPCLLTPASDPEGLAAGAGAARVVQPVLDSVTAGILAFADMTAGELERMGQSARRLAVEHFNWERTAELLLDAYKDHR